MRNRVLSDLGRAINEFDRIIAVFTGYGVHFDLQFFDGEENVFAGLLLHLDQGMDLEISLLLVNGIGRSGGRGYGLPGDAYNGIYPKIFCNLTFDKNDEDLNDQSRPKITISVETDDDGREPEMTREIELKGKDFIGPIPKNYYDLQLALSEPCDDTPGAELDETTMYRLVDKLAEEVGEIFYQMKLRAVPHED